MSPSPRRTKPDGLRSAQSGVASKICRSGLERTIELRLIRYSRIQVTTMRRKQTDIAYFSGPARTVPNTLPPPRASLKTTEISAPHTHRGYREATALLLALQSETFFGWHPHIRRPARSRALQSTIADVMSLTSRWNHDAYSTNETPYRSPVDEAGIPPHVIQPARSRALQTSMWLVPAINEIGTSPDSQNESGASAE